MQLVYSNGITLSWLQREEIMRIYSTLKEEHIKRYYNLHYMTQRNLPKDQFIDLFNVEGLKIHNQYFLNMTPGSFTRVHSDNNDLVKQTSITLLENNDLEGGEIIVYEPHYKSDMVVPEDGSVINRYHDEYNPGEPVIPIVVKQGIGETITYGPNVQHSVSKVLKGNRLVLVTWYE